MEINAVSKINGEIAVPGDKSISHRAAIISSISGRNVVISNFLFSDDCINTVEILKKLGVNAEKIDRNLIIQGKRIESLKEPEEILYVGNSGTTIRILAGMLSATGFVSVLTGDLSINNRPMERIIRPLSEMGATIYGRDNNTRAPLIILGNKNLKGKSFNLDISSAQVKSSILLAALSAEGTTEIIQPEISRDHTERMLEYFGADIEYTGKYTKISPGNTLEGRDIFVPGDISSAAYFIVAALILKDSSIIIRNVGINPTRSYCIEILKSMGARVEIDNKRSVNNEPLGDIKASSSVLHAIEIDRKCMANIIDEIPVLAVAAAFAEGKTVISGAGELRFKESDRIKSITSQFTKLGVDIREKEDGMVINGNRNLKIKDSTVDGMNDHRIGMSLAILGLRSTGTINITGSEYIDTSFPGFKYELRKAIS